MPKQPSSPMRMTCMHAQTSGPADILLWLAHHCRAHVAVGIWASHPSRPHLNSERLTERLVRRLAVDTDTAGVVREPPARYGNRPMPSWALPSQTARLRADIFCASPSLFVCKCMSIVPLLDRNDWRDVSIDDFRRFPAASGVLQVRSIASKR